MSFKLFFKYCLATIFIFFAAISCRAATILYPGTFAPFHMGHFSEVDGVLNSFPESRVVILPIREAYYSSARPDFFSYEEIVRMAKIGFKSDDRVTVSEDLRTLNHDVFSALLLAAEKLEPGERPRFLIGTDVLELWRNLPGFGHFLNQVTLLVSTDPSETTLTTALKTQFAKSSNVHFFDFVKRAIRSRQLRSILMRDGIKSNALSELLPSDALLYFQSDDFQLTSRIRDHMSAVRFYLLSETKKEILPRLASVLDPIIYRTIKDNPSAIEFISSHDMKQGASICRLAFLIQKSLPEHLNLVSALYFAFRDHQIEKVLSRYDEDVKLVTSGSNGKQNLTARANSRALGVYAVHLSPYFSRFQKHIIRFDIKDPSSVRERSVSPNKTVTVYRGVRYTSDLRQRYKNWLSEGFLSKIALRLVQKGVPVADAVIQSHNVLLHRGILNSIVNHTLVSGREDTPMISTTLDKRTAIAYAGVGGMVFTIRVPAESGYFTNDLMYWSDTPWASAPPKYTRYEFAIDSQIPAKDIVDVEQVTQMVPSDFTVNPFDLVRTFYGLLRLSIAHPTSRWNSPTKCDALLTRGTT